MKLEADLLRELKTWMSTACERGENAIVPTKTKTFRMGKHESGLGKTVLRVFGKALSI